MAELTDANAILNLQDGKVVPLQIPEWDGSTVYIRTISGTERDTYECMMSTQLDKGRMNNFRAELVIRVLSDADGKRLFTDLQAIAVGRLSAAALDRIWEAGLDINGMSKDSAEELEKNSEAAPSGSSGSDSPDTSESQ